MAARVVSSGQTVSGLVLSAGDTLEVKSGGLAINTVVSGSDTVTIDAGGLTRGTVFTSGGYEYVSGTVSNTALNGNAQEIITSGAASGTTANGSYISVEGGSIVGAVINSASTLYDYNYFGPATVSGTVVNSSGQITLAASAGTVTGTVLSGGTEYVDSGATAIKTTVASGGLEVVYSGGTVSSATVLSGGTQHVSGGGTQFGTTVSSGGTQTVQHFYVVSSGQTVSGLVLNPADTLEVKSGGLAINTVISGTDTVTVDAGGITQGTVFTSGGTETVSGTVSNTVLNGFASESIVSGGIVSGTIATSSYIYVEGGSISGAVLNNSGSLYEYYYSGSTVSGTVVKSGGQITLETSAGSATGTVLSGGTEYVDYGATAIKTIVASGGLEVVYSGGTVSGTAVLSGGAQHVSGGGTQVGTVVSSGGLQSVQNFYIVSSGQTSSGLVLNPADTLEVKSGGLAINTVVSGTDTVTIDAGGVTQGTVFTSGGYENVSGTVSGTVLNSYAQEYIVSGAVASGTTATSSYIYVEGGSAIGAVLNSSGNLYQYNYYSGSTVSGTVVKSGGQITLETSAGSATGTVLSGGTEYVDYGATVISTIVASGGVEVVYSGGTASGTTVLSGGTQHVSGGGTQIGTTVSSGGTQTIQHFYIISSGQTVSGLVLNPADTLEVKSGGLAIKTVVSGADTVTVDAGGITQGTVFTSGGTETVSGTVSGTVLNSFASESVFSGGVASGTTATSSTIYVEGGTISGAVINNSAGLYQYYYHNGSIVSGTVVKSGGQITLETSGGTASGTVLSGGTEYVDYGATATSTTVASGGLEVVYSGGTTSATNVLSGGQLTVYGGGTDVATTVQSGGYQQGGTAGPIFLTVSTLSSATIGTAGMVAVTYQNTGSTPVAAPIIELSSDGAVLTTSGSTAAASSSVTFLGTGYTSTGVLSAGESDTQYLTFTPTGTVAGTTFSFDVGVVQAGQPLDLTSLEASLKPASVDATDWANVSSAFAAEVGTTTTSLDAALAAEATELSQAGAPTNDVATLLQDEVLQATGGLQPSPLVSTVDLAGPGSLASLQVSRVYEGTLVTRDAPGLFGTGWVSPYDSTVVTDSSGNVIITTLAGVEAFTLQAGGTYVSASGTGDTLTVKNGAATLTDTQGNVTQFLANGKFASITDSSGNAITAHWTTSGTLGSLTSSDGETITITANASGHVTKAADSDGQSVTYTYDTTGTQLLSETGPAGTTSYAYVAANGTLSAGALSNVTNPDGTQRNFTYDTQGRLASQSGASGSGLISYTYPSTGEMVETDALGNATTLLFNAQGEVAKETDALGNSVAVTYDSAGLVSSAKTAAGTSSYTYDSLGNVTSYTNPLGETVTATYAAGTNELTSVTDGRGDTIAYGYDSAGQVGAIVYQDESGATYKYNASGLLTSSKDPAGNTTTYTYNTAGALTKESFADGTSQSYTYDAAGDLLSATATNGGVTAYTYNAAHQLTSVTDANNRVESYSYNSAGLLSQRTEPDGSITSYSFNAAGQLTSLKDGTGALIESYSYNAAGQLTAESKGNGTATAYTYDKSGRVTDILNTNADGTTASDYKYSYNAASEVSQVVTTDGTWTYGYDALGELTKANFASTNTAISNQALSYTYDAAGNRTSSTANGVVTYYTTNDLNQYTAVGGTTYTYDADGNLASSKDATGTTTYLWNDAGQLVTVKSPTTTTTYQYDALGSVIATTQNGVITENVIDPLAFLSDQTGSRSSIAQTYGSANTAQSTYVYGANGLAYSLAGHTNNYFNTDIADNITGVSGNAGTLTQDDVYGPFGTNLYGNINSAYGFGGGAGDITSANLIQMGSRFYNPVTGDFIQRDPLGDIASLNFYQYADNRPTSIIDPTGDLGVGVIISGNAEGGVPGAGSGVNTAGGTVGFINTTTGATSIGGFASVGVVAQSGGSTLNYPSNPTGSFVAGGSAGVGVGFIITNANRVSDLNDAFDTWSINVQGLGSIQFSFGHNSDGEPIVTGSYTNGPSVGASFSRYPTNTFSTSPTVNTAPKSPQSSNQNTAGALGCPHFTTFDGLNFDFQGAGEFIAAKSTVAGDTFQVQLRIEPEGSSDSSVSIITQIAVQVGTDRVTFGVPQYNDAARPQVVWVDGKASTISLTNPVLTLAGGTVTEISSNEYQVALSTGETVTVNPFGDGMGFNIALPSNAAPGSVQGFLGPDKGQADDFSLPDGTVLKQPLTQTQLYTQFANAWRITDATSLLDYSTGQTTATFTNSQYPRQILTLADFPADLVAKAAALVSAAGITDPTLAADAEFDYISMGNPSFITEDATVAAKNPSTATQAVITATTTPTPSIGALPVSAAVTASTATATAVTFDVSLTSAATTDTVVNYVVTPGVDYLSNTAGKVFFTASDFGGTLPSGTVTIAAGQTEAAVTIAVPNAALGTAPAKWLGVTVTTPGTDPIYDPTVQAEVLSNTPTAGTPAAPVITLLTSASALGGASAPKLTQSGTTYTLNLGQITGGTTPTQLQFALANTAAAGSDSLVSQILSTTGTGFTVTAGQPSTAILAGSSYSGLYLQPLTTTLGAQTETITFSAADTNSSGYDLALSNITLVVQDTVVAPTGTAPTISGVKATQATTSEKPVTLFAGVTLADSNSGSPTETLTIVQTGTGTLSGTGLVSGVKGTYTLSGTAATVTSVLDALVFTPVAGAAGSSTTTSFALSDASSVSSAAATATVAVTNTDSAPVVTLATTPTVSNASTATLGTASPSLGSDALSVTLTSDPAFATGSTLALTNGKLVYTPGTITAAKAGSDTLGYTVTDTVTGAVTTEAQAVTLNNGPVPLVTLATTPSVSNAGTATLGTAAPGLGSDALSVRLTSDAAFATGSTLALTNGKLVYTPGTITAAKVGSDTLGYTVTDSVTGAVSAETQAVTLSNGPAPVVTLAATPTGSNTAAATLGSAAPGLGSDALAVTLTSDADFETGSTLTLSNGKLVYTPGTITAAGSDILGYVVTDSVTGAATAKTQTVTLVGSTTSTLTGPITIGDTLGNSLILSISSATPFANVTITDSDSGTVTAAVTESTSGNGTLSSNVGGTYNAAAGAYTVSGTASTVQAALAALTFTPTKAGTPASGMTTVTRLALAVSDTAGATAGTSADSVTVASNGSIVVNPPGGGSLNYVLNPTSTVAETINTYSGINATGSLVSTIVDNNDGTAALYAFNPTSTVTQTAAQYSSTDPTNGAPAGPQISDVIDNTDGTSVIYSYNPSSTVKQTTAKFAGTNPDGSATGAQISDVVDNTDGTSLIYSYNPSGTVLQTTAKFAGTNPVDGSPTGAQISDVVDNTDGTSILYAYNPTTTVTQTATKYSATNADGSPGGTQLSVVFDYTSGHSAVTYYGPLGVPGTLYFSGPDGTGSQLSSAPSSIAAANATTVNTITVSSANQLIDPGAGSATIQFISGAASDTVMLYPSSLDQLLNFDPATDVLDAAKLFAAAGLTAPNATAGYLTVSDQGSDAVLAFDPTGQGGGSAIALLQGLGASVNNVQQLLIKSS